MPKIPKLFQTIATALFIYAREHLQLLQLHAPCPALRGACAVRAHEAEEAEDARARK